jgi:hypothetical protein
VAEGHEIRIGTPKILGVDPKEPDLLQVRVPLSSSPDADWAAIFQTTIPPGVEMPVGMRRPELVHRSRFIELRVEDAKLLEHVAVVREMVAATNALYASEIAKRNRLTEKERLAEEGTVRRVEDAQRRLDEEWQP